MIGNKIADMEDAVMSRTMQIDDDQILRDYFLLGIATKVEKGSADLDIHPEDVQYIISKRMTWEGRKYPQEVLADDPRLKSDFSLDPERLEEVVKSIDYRLIAARVIAEIQLETWDTEAEEEELWKLGKIPCFLGSLGDRDAKALMPMLTHEVRDEAQARFIIYDYIRRNHSPTPDALMVLAKKCGVWIHVTEAEYNASAADAIQRQIEGKAVHAYDGVLRAIGKNLQSLQESLRTTMEAGSGLQIDQMKSLTEAFTTSVKETSNLKQLLSSMELLSGTLPQQFSSLNAQLLSMVSALGMTNGKLDANNVSLQKSLLEAMSSMKTIAEALEKSMNRRFGEVTTDGGANIGIDTALSSE